jgi:hypothetical protein
MEVDLGHQHLLGKDVPAGPGAVQAIQQPAPLAPAEDRAARVEAFGAGHHLPATTGRARLVVAVLPGVEDVQLGQVAEGQAPIQGQVGPVRWAAPQGEMLPVGAVGGGPAAGEGGRVAATTPGPS